MPLTKDADTDSRIKVDSDGVKLGWNVLAILATFGLGLYVSNIVTPLEQNAQRQNKVVEKLIEEFDKHVTISSDNERQILNEHHFLSQKVSGLGAAVNHLVTDMARVQKLSDEQAGFRYKWDVSLQTPVNLIPPGGPKSANTTP